MSVLTLITLAVLVISAFARRGLGFALAIGAATPAGAVLVLGPIVVPTFYGVGLVALAAVVGAVLLRSPDTQPKPWTPALPLLIALLVYGCAVTLIAPFLFNGLPLVLPTATSRLVAGTLTNSNFAQMVYLLIGVGVIAFLARSRSVDPSLLGLAVGTSIYLSAWRYTSTYFGVPFPEGVFDNSPSFLFIQTAPGGADRFRGIFSEPSSLAASCLVAIVYFMVTLRTARAGRRVFALVTIVIATYLGVVSTSTTFLIAGLVVAAIAIAAGFLAFLSGRSAISAVAAIGGCLLVVVAIYIVPVIVEFTHTAVERKLVGSSFEDRSGSDSDSLDVFLSTWGIGVGLGSGRGSSLLPTMLSTVGVVGTLLFAGAVLLLITRAAGSTEMRPALWVVITILVAKLVAGADLADPSGLVWLSLGMLAHHAAELQRWPNLRVAPTLSHGRLGEPA